MGGKSLAIVPSYEGEMAKSGDFLQGEIESDIFSSVTEKLNPLQAKVENVIVRADSLLVSLNDIVNTNSRNQLKASISNLNETVLNFKNISESVDRLIISNEQRLGNTLASAELMTSNLAKLSDTLVNSNLGMTVKNLETTVTNLNKILATIEAGDGTLGKLIKDEGMYTNLTNASKELEELVREMKLHPKRFVHFSLFGKKDKGYKPEIEKQ